MEDNRLGEHLRKARAGMRLSLREVEAQSGASASYMSQIEQGKRNPSADLLRRIAPVYGVSVKGLLTLAGYLDEPEVQMSEQERIDWAFNAVVTDPDYKFGTALRAPELSLEAKRFMVEVYERATGRKLL